MRRPRGATDVGVREDYELRDGASPSALERCAISALRGEMRMTGRRLCAQIRAIVRPVGNARSSSRIEGVERPTYFARGPDYP